MYFIGGLTISLCAAAIFVLAFELPFTRAEKILVGKFVKWSWVVQVGAVLTLMMGGPDRHQAATKPVVAVDTNKKDLVVNSESAMDANVDNSKL